MISNNSDLDKIEEDVDEMAVTWVRDNKKLKTIMEEGSIINSPLRDKT